VKAGTGMDAQHPHVFLPNAHTHAHSRNRKYWEGRAGGEQHCTKHGVKLVAQVPRRPADTSLHARRKQADHTAHHALPVPALAAQRPCMHDPLRRPCTCMSVRRACVHPRLVNAFGTVRVFWQGDERTVVCKNIALQSGTSCANPKIKKV